MPVTIQGQKLIITIVKKIRLKRWFRLPETPVLRVEPPFLGTDSGLMKKAYSGYTG